MNSKPRCCWQKPDRPTAEWASTRQGSVALASVSTERNRFTGPPKRSTSMEHHHLPHPSHSLNFKEIRNSAAYLAFGCHWHPHGHPLAHHGTHGTHGSHVAHGCTHGPHGPRLGLGAPPALCLADLPLKGLQRLSGQRRDKCEKMITCGHTRHTTHLCQCVS